MSRKPIPPCRQPGDPGTHVAPLPPRRVTAPLVWQGFNLRWFYNHRANRIGSHVGTDAAGRTRMVAVAASGSGEDTARLEVRGAWVEGPGVRAFTGVERLVLVGSEGEPLDGRVTVSIPLATGEAGEWATPVVLLSGFDLVAVVPATGPGSTADGAEAEKLQRLSVQARDARVVGGALTFELAARFVGRCRSLECRVFESLVTYRLDVPWTVIGGAAVTRRTTLPVRESLVWDEKTEAEPVLRFAEVDDTAAEAFLVGFSRLEWMLDREHHLVELGARCEEPVRNGGRCRIPWQLTFLNWRTAMADYQPLAFRRGGAATMSAVLEVVELDGARVTPEKRTGCLHWTGHNTPAEGSGAVWSRVVAPPGGVT